MSKKYSFVQVIKCWKTWYNVTISIELGMSRLNKDIL